MSPAVNSPNNQLVTVAVNVVSSWPQPYVDARSSAYGNFDRVVGLGWLVGDALGWPPLERKEAQALGLAASRRAKRVQATIAGYKRDASRRRKGDAPEDPGELAAALLQQPVEPPLPLPTANAATSRKRKRECESQGTSQATQLEREADPRIAEHACAEGDAAVDAPFAAAAQNPVACAQSRVQAAEAAAAVATAVYEEALGEQTRWAAGLHPLQQLEAHLQQLRSELPPAELPPAEASPVEASPAEALPAEAESAMGDEEDTERLQAAEEAHPEELEPELRELSWGQLYTVAQEARERNRVLLAWGRDMRDRMRTLDAALTQAAVRLGPVGEWHYRDASDEQKAQLWARVCTLWGSAMDD